MHIYPDSRSEPNKEVPTIARGIETLARRGLSSRAGKDPTALQRQSRQQPGVAASSRTTIPCPGRRSIRRRSATRESEVPASLKTSAQNLAVQQGAGCRSLSISASRQLNGSESLKEDSNQSGRGALTSPTRYHVLPLVLSHSLRPHQC